MKTIKEVNEGKQRIIDQGRLIDELTQSGGYQLLMKQLNIVIVRAKEDIILSTDYEDLLQKRAYWNGLLQLAKEVENFLAKYKAQIKK